MLIPEGNLFRSRGGMQAGRDSLTDRSWLLVKGVSKSTKRASWITGLK